MKRSFTIPGETDAREIVAAIEAWSGYASPRETSRLWGILTALRGPDGDDDENCTVKYELTARLRAFACPRFAEESGATVNHAPNTDHAVVLRGFHSAYSAWRNDNGDSSAVVDWLVDHRVDPSVAPHVSLHFISHMARAIYALGLEETPDARQG